MTEREIIQEIARRAELTLDAATRAYKAMQSIAQLGINKKEITNRKSSSHVTTYDRAFNLAAS